MIYYIFGSCNLHVPLHEFFFANKVQYAIEIKLFP